MLKTIVCVGTINDSSNVTEKLDQNIYTVEAVRCVFLVLKDTMCI